MSEITEIICGEIGAAGVVPFTRFMELALYHPLHGYYERQSKQIGCQGDFHTSVSVGDLFGGLLAFQFSRWLDSIVDPALPRLQIVEAGAHDGQLAADILGWIARHDAARLGKLEYWIIEPSEERQGWQRRRLEMFSPQVRWFSSLESIPRQAVNGIIFCNELLDAFPVSRVGWDARDQRWFEWGVGWNEGRFVWKRMPLEANASLDDRVEPSLFPALGADLLGVLPDGFTTEICPAAGNWWSQAAGRLGRGKLLTIDYGLCAEEFFTPSRADGTLRAYRRHHVSGDLLADPGGQDLTAHVNFTAVQAAGEAAGLETVAFQTQSAFLTRILDLATDGGGAVPGWLATASRQLNTLIHPEHFGRSFKVLLQSRD